MYYSDTHIVAKEATDILAAAANENDKAQKNFAFKNNGHAFQKLSVHWWVMQKILKYSCQCIIY